VDELRLFAKPEGPNQRADPEAALDQALLSCTAKLSGVDVVRALPPGLPKVSMGEMRLAQVLANLISNAADAVAGRERRVVTVSVRGKDELVEFVVDDSGPGLTPDVRERIFEPWFTTKGHRGTGLGLAICRQYVSLAGGQLTAANNEAGGARFTLTLPLAPAA
jgi:C4-dicarboxylate-specific signal transduction histidine kinase